MEQEPQKENPAIETPVNYEERVVKQQAVVDKLAAEYKEKPSVALLAEIKRKSDLLLHLKNVAKGNPRERARQAARSARTTTLDHAIKQIPK